MVNIKLVKVDDKMKCEVEYCIYNRDFECIVEITQLNSLGMCEKCILISLERDFLEAGKETAVARN